MYPQTHSANFACKINDYLLKCQIYCMLFTFCVQNMIVYRVNKQVQYYE